MEMANSEKAPKVYTRVGDKGQTSLIGGTRVSKGHLRLDAYGTVDELNSVIGMIVCELAVEVSGEEKTAITGLLAHIQAELFDVGSRLACEDEKLLEKLPSVDEARIVELERAMDAYSENLKPLRNFILPGGSRAAAHAHLARTVCRRAERLSVQLSETASVEPIVIRYLNRLSDYFFVLARHFNRLGGINEPIWQPRK
jgi:cob(I)alamin adenosyltransferase